MKMKTSPNDVSNKEILQEFRKVSEKMDVRVGAVESSNRDILNKLDNLSEKIENAQSETLEAIHELSSQTDERFNRLEMRMDKSEFRLNRVESLMVTKDYLDDKLADLRSDISQNTAKQIQKALN